MIAIDDPLKRTFYEVECIRGNWSVRELKGTKLLLRARGKPMIFYFSILQC